MKRSARIAGILFLVLSIVEVITLCRDDAVHSWIKPLLIPTLAVAALCALLPKHKGWRTTLLTIGMALHAAGDTLLLFDDRSFVWFAAGLGAFLLGHFCYLAVLVGFKDGTHGWKEALVWLLPPACAVPAASLFHAEGALHYVLVLYAATLFYVTASGGLWILRGRKLGWRILAGGLFFIVSDTMLALHTFNGVDFPLRHSAVMGSYLFAEWLLVSGMVRQRFFD